MYILDFLQWFHCTSLAEVLEVEVHYFVIFLHSQLSGFYFNVYANSMHIIS